MIKSIFFDLDDTLLWDEKSVKDAFERTRKIAAEHYELDITELEESVRKNARELYASYPTYEFTQMIGINPFEGLWAEFTDEGGQFPELKEIVPTYRKESWTNGLKDIGIDDPELGAKLGEAFPEERRKTAHLYKDSLNVLDQLKEKYDLLLLTNGSPALQNLKLELSSELRPYFKHIVISGGFGKGKPAAETFEHALELMEVDRSEVLMVGDNLNTDILGANKTNIRSVWINRHGKKVENAQPDYEVTSLTELLDLIQSIDK